MSTLDVGRQPERISAVQTLLRLMLGATLLLTGTSHLTVAREEFQAQVPRWVPLPPDLVVVGSGVAELALGAALAALPRRRAAVGWAAAAFFVAVFPGNIAQYIDRVDAFGMHTDRMRAARLLLQPVFIAWALWSTGAWQAWRDRRRG
jgi:uncharacterized membrane protein